MLEHREANSVNYMVAESPHPNYHEMEALVKAMCPSIQRRLVPYIYKNTKLRR
jgi:hypothetical protein